MVILLEPPMTLSVTALEYAIAQLARFTGCTDFLLCVNTRDYFLAKELLEGHPNGLEPVKTALPPSRTKESGVWYVVNNKGMVLSAVPI